MMTQPLFVEASDYKLSLSPPPHTKGTRIIYDRKFLLECRSSPVAKTPPRGLPNIPGVTSPPSRGADEKACNGELLNNNSIPAPESSNTGTFTSQRNVTHRASHSCCSLPSIHHFK